MGYRHFTEMPVWRKGHEVVLKVRFYLHARGSCFEVQSQSHVARDVDYLAPGDFAKLNQDLGGIIHDLNKIMVTLTNRPQP